MGHERVGFLPKTHRWDELIAKISLAYSSDVPVADVASQTLQNVQRRSQALLRDDAVQAVFTFLVKLARACRAPDPRTELASSGISLPSQTTILSIVRSLKDDVPGNGAATEYGQLTISAAADAIGQWHKENATQQTDMFRPADDFLSSWRKLGDGSGFCELSRLFFGKVTERYLNYFLERAASAKCPSVAQREQFQRGVSEHVSAVSQHAFETAKITQSFAAGWFNSHARARQPDAREVEGFLAVAFGKMRDELRREGESA